MRSNSTLKYRAIQEAFKEMYHGGMRTNVIYEELGKQFFLSRDRLGKIMKLELPETNKEEDAGDRKHISHKEPAN